MGDYLRGHPQHPKPIEDGRLTVDGAEGLRFTKSMPTALPLPAHEQKPDIVIELPLAVAGGLAWSIAP